ncbi:MAG: hypothetical protein CVU36_09385 [Betaproteobacteria bacterium HGW-Betaproteobacteria-9]|nr:MAG: hypothetical protein CVU36_09385 [Betaproteobacteria bacterium HGW-Betaproteobacteria-9]
MHTPSSPWPPSTSPKAPGPSATAAGWWTSPSSSPPKPRSLWPTPSPRARPARGACSTGPPDAAPPTSFHKRLPLSLHQKHFDPCARGPLHGVRVIDLSRLVSGNTLTMMLADYGAEVVKIEAPRGDSLRAWVKGGHSTDWKTLGRNKKSVGLDLRQPEGMALLKRLIAQASVLVENFRAGTLEAMGIGPDVLHELNPQLIIARITGFGQQGPYRTRPGFGTLIEGMCGMADLQGFPDRPPVLPPGPIADTCAGFCGAMAVLAALREVEHGNGRGQVIDQSLFTPLFMAMGAQAADYRATGRVRTRQSNNNLYQTNDASTSAARCRWSRCRSACCRPSERASTTRSRSTRVWPAGLKTVPRFADGCRISSAG